MAELLLVKGLTLKYMVIFGPNSKLFRASIHLVVGKIECYFLEVLFIVISL